MSLCSCDYLLYNEVMGNIERVAGGGISEINAGEKMLCINYMYKLSRKFNCKSETFATAILIFNNCIARVAIKRSDIYVYCAVCVAISAKKHEVSFVPTTVAAMEVYEHERDFRRIELGVIAIASDALCCVTFVQYIEYIQAHNESFGESTTAQYHLALILCKYYMIGDIEVITSVIATAAWHIACDIMRTLALNPFNIPIDIIEIVKVIILQRMAIVLQTKELEKYARIKCVTLRNNIIAKNKQPIPAKAGQIDQRYLINRASRLVPIIPGHIGIGKYMGSGGFGGVYLTEVNGEKLAQKRIYSTTGEDGYVASYIREISIIQSTTTRNNDGFQQHKNVIGLRYICSTRTDLYLDVMDSDLHVFIKSSAAHDRAKFTRHITRELLEGIAYIHSCGIIHRDIKPANVLITGDHPNMSVKYCDFGSSRGCGIVSSGAYTVGVCTPQYAAPELLLNFGKYGALVDIWSIGCVLSEFISGDILFQADKHRDIKLKIFQILGTPSEYSWPGISTVICRKNIPDWLPTMPEYTCDNVIQCIIEQALTVSPIYRPAANDLLALLNS